MRLAEQIEIGEIGLDVLINGDRFDGHAVERLRSHASEVRNRAIGHEPALEAFNVSSETVLAWFYNDDPKHPLMISPKTASVVAFNQRSRCCTNTGGKDRKSANGFSLLKAPRSSETSKSTTIRASGSTVWFVVTAILFG